jgi:hypothetical protein
MFLLKRYNLNFIEFMQKYCEYDKKYEDLSIYYSGHEILPITDI